MPPGKAWRDPQKLCPCIREKLERVLAGAEERGIRVTLLETLRDEERQRYYMSQGSSRTMNSKHLPQEPNGLSLAFDLAPTEYLSERLWNPEGELWAILGHLGELQDLQWGGRWTLFRDRPHFQLQRCECLS
jgi:peptidoglycan L-alanyl-D-glutamate endopeptidase CwlK